VVRKNGENNARLKKQAACRALVGGVGRAISDFKKKEKRKRAGMTSLIFHCARWGEKKTGRGEILESFWTGKRKKNGPPQQSCMRYF